MIKDLFKSQKISKMLSKEDLSPGYAYPAYSADSNNNGIIGYTNQPEFICDSQTPVYVTFGDHTRTINIARKSFSVLDNVKVLIPCTSSNNALLFIISAWQKQIPHLGYARHWKVAKDCVVRLPVKNGKIDFDFMESFIAELEAERVAELEAYLYDTNLKDYKLTKEEEKVLYDFNNDKILLKSYTIDNFFEIKSYKKRFDANKVHIMEYGKFPYIVRMGTNNGQKGYIDEDKQYLNEGNTISFGQDTATMYYQEKPYFTGDKIKILKPRDSRFNKVNAQFFLSSMKIAFKQFSWGSTSFSVDMIKGQSFYLPIKDDNIDFTTMETLISAVQKLVIKDVVLYNERKITATKDIVKEM